MAKTTENYFSGIAKWARVFEPDDKYGNFTINVELDADSQKKFDASGIQVRPKVDAEDGKTYYRFRRSGDDGKPLVLDNQNEPFSNKIGNGSKVTVRVQSYDTKKHGVGHRLQAVRVDEWVQFDPKTAAERPVVLPDKMDDGSLPF
jgi:hypothetical protein